MDGGISMNGEICIDGDAEGDGSESEWMTTTALSKYDFLYPGAT